MASTLPVDSDTPTFDDDLELEPDDSIAPGPPATPDVRKSVKTEPGLGTASTPPPEQPLVPIALAPAAVTRDDDPIEIPSTWSGLARHKWLALGGAGALLAVAVAVLVLGSGSPSRPARHRARPAGATTSHAARLPPPGPVPPPIADQPPASVALPAPVAAEHAPTEAPSPAAVEPVPPEAPAPAAVETPSRARARARPAPPRAPARPRAHQQPSREDTLDPFAR